MKKSRQIKSAMVAALAAQALVVPALVMAESQLVVGPGSASASLDFQIVIPRVLFLGISTGAAVLGNNATIDIVTFDYGSFPAGMGTGVAAVGPGVPVRVLGNNGPITLTASTTGPLTNDASPADTIPWSEISATSSAAELPHPAIPLSGAGASVNVALSSGTKITDRNANWTFSFANSALFAPGTYGALVARNSRITYTAAMP